MKVTTCEKCRFWKESSKSAKEVPFRYGHCQILDLHRGVKLMRVPDDYCSRAERRTSDGQMEKSDRLADV